jgi:hypothetical protein
LNKAAGTPDKNLWKKPGAAHIFSQMKLASLLTFVFFAHAAAYAQKSAYQALRAFGAERGQEQLNKVIEVQGRNGAPQPSTWKIVLDDPSARGGVREVEVRKGAVISERTPVRDYSGAGANAVMDFQKLNLDSEGAFTIANSEAKKAGVGFDKVDYTLRIGDESAAPVWILQLLDDRDRQVATLHIGADTGTVIRRDGFGRKGRVTDEDYISEERDVVVRERVRGRDRRYEEDEAEYDTHRGVKHRIKKAFVGAGASLEEFFTGKRTLDRKYRDD